MVRSPALRITGAVASTELPSSTMFLKVTLPLLVKSGTPARSSVLVMTASDPLPEKPCTAVSIVRLKSPGISTVSAAGMT